MYGDDMELKNGLSKEQRSDVSGALAKVLADTYALFVKTQNFHWNTHGPQFYALHVMTEKQYKEMFEAIDEIAERIRALGFFVEGSMGAFLKLTSIQEEHQVHTTMQYLEHLVESHEIALRGLRSVGNLAAKHADHGTADMIGRLCLFHEKAAWMLRSQL